LLKTLSSSPGLRARYSLIITLLLTAAGFGIRLHYLAGDSFWIDEIATIQGAQSAATAFQAARDHPPLIYLITALSINTLGENEFAARIPSAFAGTLAIPAIVVLGTLLGAPGAGLWAAFLLALSPFHLRYSQLSRHYALLMLLSLISYIMLFRAVKQPKWSYWLVYGITTAANLYTHFAAMLVLGAQAIVIAGWSMAQINRRRLAVLIYPAAAILLALIIFIPWVPRFVASLEYNVGAETVSETGSVMPLSAWLQEAYQSFGMYSEFLAAILLILVLLGVLFWLIDRAWLNLGFILSGLITPLLLILLFQVARGALPRYIIFMLPMYLVAAGFGIHRSLRLVSVGIHRRVTEDTEDYKGEKQDHWLLKRQLTMLSQASGKQTGPILYGVATIVVAIAFIIISWPILQERYRTVYHDWQGLTQYIRSQVEGEIVLVIAELNEPNYLNKMRDFLPYYLEEVGLDYLLLPGGRLTSKEVSLIPKVNTPVWAIIYDHKGPPDFEDGRVEVTHFPTDLYVAHENDKIGTSLDKVIAIYEAIINRSDPPKPRCQLQRDLALMYLAAEENDKTRQVLNDAKELCPDLDHWTLVPIYEGLLLEESTVLRSDEALAIARLLLSHNPKNEIALNFLTSYDLLELLESGEGQILANDSPEPVQKERFVMPQDGDWGDVIFLHPPASVSFNIPLPEGPVTYSSRVALAPDSWSWGGDGVTFVLKIKGESGQEMEVYRQHVGNDPEDREWHEVNVPLNEYSGQDVKITLATEVGPAGDGTGDWAGWERPRIIEDLTD